MVFYATVKQPKIAVAVAQNSGSGSAKQRTILVNSVSGIEYFFWANSGSGIEQFFQMNSGSGIEYFLKVLTKGLVISENLFYECIVLQN